jgi:hypothetical protein
MIHAIGAQTQNVTFAETVFTDQMDQILFGIQQPKMAHCATTDSVSTVAQSRLTVYEKVCAISLH